MVLYIKVAQNGQITPAVFIWGTHLTCPPDINTAGVICTFLKVYPKTFLRIGSYYKTTIDKLKIMNHLKLLTKYN